MTSSLCQKLREADNFRLGDTGETINEVLETHLKSCAECREYIQYLDAADSIVEEAKMHPLLERRLMVAAINLKLPAKRTKWPRVAWRLGWATAVATVAVITTLFFTGDPAPEKAARNAVPEPSIPLRSAPPSPTAEVRSMEDGRRVIEVFPGTALWLDHGALVQAETLNASMVRFQLVRGRVVAEVGINPADFRFVVSTPNGASEARGTVFSVTVLPEGKSSTRVLEGVVEVLSTVDGADRILTAGEEIISGDRAPRPATKTAIRSDRCLFEGCPETISASPLPKNHRGPLTRKQKGAISEDARLAKKAIQDRRFTEASKMVEAFERKNPRSGETLSLLNDLSRAYRRAKHFKRAAATYKRMIMRFPGTDEATNALVALAQIELGELGKPDAAIQHFENYLNQRPGGFLSEVARAGKVRALHRLKSYVELIRAVTVYLEMHPAGFTGAEMLRRRGDAFMQRGRIKDAINDYQAVIARWPKSREAQRAMATLNACKTGPI